jgi:hypothetical protein
MPYGHQANIDLLLAAQYGRSATAPFTVSNTGANNYCSSGNQDCSQSDKLTSVVLYKTSAPGTLLINNTSGACSSGGYQDYTSTIVALEPGQQYTIKVKVGYSNQTIGGWFDLNGNNTFDSNEKLITISCSAANTEYTQNFTIPTDVTPGTFRFRLVDKYNGTPVACGNSSYGQTHDYTIVLPELYPRVENVVAVLGENSITVTWEAPTGGTPNGYNIYRDGKLNTSLLTTTTFTEENITNGVYAYNVTAVYGTKESFTQMSNVICNFLACVTPVELSVAVENNTAILTWEDSGDVEGTLLGYNILRNGTQINGALVTVKEYLDENLPAGTYSYQVQAIYEHCESELTDGITITILPCDPPTNLEGVADKDTAIITWNEPENSDGLLGYNIYRNETPLNTTPLAELKYNDEGLAVGTYTYKVSAVYEHCDESLPESVTVVIDYVGISDIQTNTYKIFPNPAHDAVNITGKVAPNVVRIYNITGQLTYQTTVCSTKMSITVATMPAGIYFIKIDSDNGSTTQKLIIK